MSSIAEARSIPQAIHDDLPPLPQVDAALDAGRALDLQPWVEALLIDARVPAVLAGTRALRQLGAESASDAIAMRVARRHPADPQAQLGALRLVLSNRGAYACWRWLQRLPLPPDASNDDRAGRLSLEGLWLASLRDDTRALDLQRQALSLQSRDPWLWVEHSYALARLDRNEDALHAARQALDLHPGYRTAVLQAARLLNQLQRRGEARSLLEQALASVESAWYAWSLHGLAEDDQRHADALELLDRVERALPRAEASWRAALDGRRADALLNLGRVAQAREHAARVPRSGYYAQLAQRLANLPDATPPQRVLLPLAMVQQHWMTCAPATLVALAGYWGHAADHVEVAQAICYDGTPQASERAWAADQGFWVRECRVDWPTSCALVEAGVPFAMATQYVGSGHLQAVVGFDHTRGTLLVRDPGEPLHVEYDAQALFQWQQSAGPRALLLLPQDQLHRIVGIPLPEADAWDLGHAQLAALQRHDRPAAVAALATLQAEHAGSDSTLRAERHLALYDGDEARILAATESLLARYPEDRNLQLSRLTSLYEVRGEAAGDDWLADLAARPAPDPLLLVRWAGRMANDARRLPEAMSAVRRVLWRHGSHGRAWNELANLLWVADGNPLRSVQPSRWASTLMPTEEWAAARHARACRVAGEPEAGLVWLRERDRVWGDRSGQPAVTLAEELDIQQRDREADAVLAAALQRRPGDTPLRLVLAERALFAHRLDEAQALLDAATDAHAPAVLRLRALLLEARGALDEALTAVREAVALEPLQLTHHRLLLRLLRRRHGDAQALVSWRPLADAYPAHQDLQRLLYDALPDHAEAVNAQLDHLQANHPGLPWLQRERAMQASRQGRHDDAVALAHAALQLAPALAVSHDVLAYCLQRRDGYAAALPSMHAAVRCDAEFEPAVRRLLGAPDGESMRAGADFVAAELRRQVLLGDGLLTFQENAAGAWPAADVLSLLRELHGRWPALWQCPVAEARQWLQLQRPDEALNLLTAAAERFPALPRVHLELAEALRHAGRIEDALQAGGRTLALTPAWNRAVRLQVDLLVKQQLRWDDAEAVLQRALHTRDGWSDADLIGLLAWVHEGQGDDTRAHAAARRSLLLDPDADWLWSLVGRVCDRAEDPAMLDTLIDDVVASRPGDAHAWLVRASHGRDDLLALEAAVQAVTLQPRNEAAWWTRFERLHRLGRHDEIESALSQLPWPVSAPMSLRAWGPRVTWVRGDHLAAIAQLRALRDEMPQDVGLCARLADWLDERGDDAGYLEQAQALVTLAPLEARSHAYHGHALFKSGRHAQALAPLQQALALSPSYTFAARQLVAAATAAGQPGLAEPALQALWPHDPGISTACEGIELAAAAGEPARARAWLERLYAIDDFELEACSRAHAACRAAGWRDTVLAGQREHVARGGGPTGVAMDWLQQRSARGALSATIEALRMQRTATGRHLLLALLRWAAQRESGLLLGWLMHHHRAAMRADDMTWGETSYVLVVLDRYRAVVRWLHDWRERDRPPVYAMANLAGALAVLRRWDDLAEVVERTLDRLPRQEDMRLWQLVLHARASDIDALEQGLARCHEWEPDPWMRQPLQALRAYAALARARAAGDTVPALRRALPQTEPRQALVIGRELRRLAQWRHTPWTRLLRWWLPP